MSMFIWLSVLCVFINGSNAWKDNELEALQSKLQGVSSLTLLVTVNDTWDPKGCIETVKTPPLIPGKKSGHPPQIQVGSCDYGAIQVGVLKATNGKDAMTIDVVFDSHVIEDASHPECQIAWNGTYLVPTAKNMEKSVLPSCLVMDSREGYHLTYYWFHLLDWSFG